MQVVVDGKDQSENGKKAGELLLVIAWYSE